MLLRLEDELFLCALIRLLHDSIFKLQEYLSIKLGRLLSSNLYKKYIAKKAWIIYIKPLSLYHLNCMY